MGQTVLPRCQQMCIIILLILQEGYVFLSLSHVNVRMAATVHL